MNKILSFAISVFLLSRFSFHACPQIPERKIFSEQNDLPAVIIDEEYQDWLTIPVLADDSGVGSFLNMLKVTNDSSFLFLYFELDSSISLNNDALLTLFLDTDNDTTTGNPVMNMGVEVEFTFGEREGRFYLNDTETKIGSSDLFLVSSPTVWSDTFEMALDRNSVINGQQVFPGDKIRILVQDHNNNTFFPLDSSANIYQFQELEWDNYHDYSIQKEDGKHIRIVAHNVLFDNLFEESVKIHFDRLYRALDPDIFTFQEIYDHDEEDVKNRLEEILPSSSEAQWYVERIHDCFVASRFEIKQKATCGLYYNGIFKLDLRPEYNNDLLIVSAHPPCCDNDLQRSLEVDAIMYTIREIKNGLHEISILDKTPIVVTGDMNLVGNDHQQKTLIEGDIFYNEYFGEDFLPDWDTTFLEDAKPQVTGLPMTFTQGISYGPGYYPKGRLDYIIYSGSVLKNENSFIFYTHTMSRDTLQEYELELEDTETASDHFPVVCDFTLLYEQNASHIPGLEDKDKSEHNKTYFQVFPNPSTGIIAIQSENNQKILVEVFSVAGKIVHKSSHKELITMVSLEHLDKGVYLIRIKSNAYSESSKLILY